MNETITLVISAPEIGVEELTFNTPSELFFEHGNVKNVYKRLQKGETWHLLNDTMLPPYPGGSKVTLKVN